MELPQSRITSVRVPLKCGASFRLDILREAEDEAVHEALGRGSNPNTCM